MSINFVENLLDRYPIISDQISRDELVVILEKLLGIIENEIEGDIVELGCYAGTTSLFISRALKLVKSKKEFHVYDSFEGLGEKTPEDNSRVGEEFKKGELKFSKGDFIRNYKKANLPLPIIHNGWFEELKDSDIPNKVAIAFLDGDYYSSISSNLKLIENKLSKGSIIIVDDYDNIKLPGAKKALDQWLSQKNNVKLVQITKSLAICEVR